MAAPEDDPVSQPADTDMGDMDDFEGIPLSIDKNRIRRLPNSTETAASFQIDGEDHTLGNALRYVIMKNPDVEFCGYSIPHPSENKLNIRIQTYDNVSAEAVLDKGLSDLIDICNVVEAKFREASDEHHNRMQE